jgi:excisionase family DNA binding protein
MIMSSEPDRLLKIDEVAAMLACSPSHVRRLRALGKLPACKTGKNSVRWKASIVAKYLQSLRDD